MGGHSFIQELGNDPLATFEEQCAVVAACLDNGICWIDTTYYQERVALGHVLQHLGRRDEARIIVWNFFRQPGNEAALAGFTPYQNDHLTQQLEELQTDRIDLLVIHSHDDRDRLHVEMELARKWREEGRVLQIGLGMARLEHLDGLLAFDTFTHVFAPYNAFHTEVSALFTEARTRGLQTVAMSPFIRGWKLDQIGGDTQEAAAGLLRWVTSQESVDIVLVSMRKPQWVRANLRAEQQGPLTIDEDAQIFAWVAQANAS